MRDEPKMGTEALAQLDTLFKETGALVDRSHEPSLDMFALEELKTEYGRIKKAVDSIDGTTCTRCLTKCQTLLL